MKEYYVLPGSLPGQILWHAKGNPENKNICELWKSQAKKKRMETEGIYCEE